MCLSSFGKKGCERGYSKFFLVTIIFTLGVLTSVFFKKQGYGTMIKAGQKAPDFSCDAVVSGEIKKNFSLHDLGNQYKIIFFYPADFTFVCPTELHAFQHRLKEFEKRSTVIVGVSTDSIETHKKWLETPKKEGGVEGITYPLMSDSCGQMAVDYGVLDEKEGLALRGLFLLDRNNVVQVATVHNFPIGRSVDEVLRVLDALQHTEKHGQVCPADWEIGKEAFEATPEGVKGYLQKS